MMLAVLVLYNQRLEQSKTFSSLLCSLDNWPKGLVLFVHDNSPVPAHNPAEFSNRPIHYLSDPSNPGVSKAYNRAAAMAKELGIKHLLILDQDTSFLETALSSYRKAIEANPDCPLIAPVLSCDGKIYSPCRQYFHLSLPATRTATGKMPTKGRSLLSSGMCIRVDVFEELGGFDEHIPLDFADHEFFGRYRHSFDSFVLIEAVRDHSFSDNENSAVPEALRRFAYFCIGARNSIKTKPDAFALFTIVLIRTLRLMARYGDFFFLSLFTTHFLGLMQHRNGPNTQRFIQDPR